MGYQIAAGCKKCGFQQNLIFGSGMEHTPETLYIPALDLNKGHLHSVNIAEPLPPGLDLMFYNEQKMFEVSLDESALVWNGVRLSPSANICPKCCEFALNFEVAGKFD